MRFRIIVKFLTLQQARDMDWSCFILSAIITQTQGFSKFKTVNLIEIYCRNGVFTEIQFNDKKRDLC